MQRHVKKQRIDGKRDAVRDRFSLNKRHTFEYTDICAAFVLIVMKV